MIVGLSYIINNPKIYGKKPDGQLKLLNSLILLPYLLISWTTWYLERMFNKEDVCNEIVHGIWLGRRPFLNELPPHVETIIDLAAEFPVSKSVRKNFNYLSFPMLDAAAPNREMMLNLLTTVKGIKGNLYIHCAQGHGRSATVVAVILVLKGFTDSLVNAEQIIKSKRPKVNIHKEQMESAIFALKQYCNNFFH